MMKACKDLIPKKEFLIIVDSVMDERRINQKRTTWLKNVQRIMGFDEITCVKLYDKIKPFK